MNPGSLVRINWEGKHIPLYEKIHGVYSAEFYKGDVGIVIDSGYSNTDVPYVRVLLPDGRTGWARYERVEVIR